MSWQVLSTSNEDIGYFRIYITPPGGARTEVTIFRNAPTELLSYASADPFGDSTCQLQFGMISVLDDLGSGDLIWFKEFADVDIELYHPDSNTAEPVFEGFFVSFDWQHSDTSSMLTVTCQGALYQVDRYVSYPQYPSVPVAHEVLIADAFSPYTHPNLRTQALFIEWPDDWNVLAYRTADAVGPAAGGNSTGFKTRVTGGWEKTLTGFISNLLGVMYTSDFADQWTIRKDVGRQPTMHIRYASRTPDFSLYAGQPGVSISISRDYTQYANVIYGSGTSLDGTSWSRQSVASDNSLTAYVPMAADPKVYPDNSAVLDPTIMRSEAYVQFEDGMEETTALKTSQLMLRKNEDPGYSGTLTLTIDPVEISRYLIKAGMTVQLRYFGGTGSDGMKLHITQVEVDVSGGTVSLTVDSKYRDALTVAEALARTRDPLTTIRMLQVGKQSILIPDQMAPWSYTLGSGYVPKAAKPFFDTDNTSGEIFPFDKTAKKFPPKANPNFYIGINAGATSRNGRWTGPIPIRMAEKGDIRLTQFALYDRNGNRVQVPFHVSLYYVNVTMGDMPFDDNGHSPFIPGAFQSTNEFGLQIPSGAAGATALPQQSLLIGWGDGNQPAGYSPGTKTNGDPATGLLIDETTWSFDCTNNPDFQQNPAQGFTQPESAITIYAMFYAEYHDWVYAIGRLYNKPAGLN